MNARGVSLAKLTVFHMDECLDWQGRLLPRNHPYNFRTFMERHFYGGDRALPAVPEEQRFWLTAVRAIDACARRFDAAPIDITLGGWGQDGHVAYNQARRHPYSHVSAWRSSPSPRSASRRTTWTRSSPSRSGPSARPTSSCRRCRSRSGMRECLSARKVRLFSDTGAWKQTALRVALFSEPTPEYPMTLLQRHPDALITATRRHGDAPDLRASRLGACLNVPE